MRAKQIKPSSDKSAPDQITVSQKSHLLFGSMMKESLIPLKLEVESGYEVGKGPPKLDVLIIRRFGKSWSNAQLEFLPDGIRQSKCKHVILELKYTESINQIAIFQTIGYLGSYVRFKQLKVNNVCAFIVSAKKPQKSVEISMQQIKQDVFHESGVINDDLAAWFFSLFTAEEVIRRYKPEDLVSKLKPEDVFRQYRA